MFETKKWKAFPDGVGAMTGFLAASAAVIAFGVLVLLLSKNLEVTYAVDACFLWIGVSLGGILLAGSLLTLVLRHSGKHSGICKRVLAGLGTLIVLWNLASSVALLQENYASNGNYWINGEETAYNRSAAISRAYGETKLIGKSESFYTQPEETLGKEQRWWRDVIFWRWQNDGFLPVLSLYYGNWILLLYCGLLIGWFAGAAAGWKRLRGLQKILYASCWLPLAIGFAGPMLDSMGLLHYSVGIPLLPEDCLPQVLPWMLRLGLMGYLLYGNAREPAEAESMSLRQKLALCGQILLDEWEHPAREIIRKETADENRQSEEAIHLLPVL